MDMMKIVDGELIDGWIDKFIYVEVDAGRTEWGEESWIWVAVRAD
jgi:hypothetical protein